MAKKKDNVPCKGVLVSNTQLDDIIDIVILYSFCNCGGQGSIAIGIGDVKECKERLKEILEG